jgi:threonine dehydrogenase-like Zn-dependent dehydrogenase
LSAQSAISFPQPPDGNTLKEQAISLNPAFASMQFGLGYGYKQPRWQEALELMQSGKCTSKKLVTHVFPLDKIKEAFEIALNPHESIKVLVEP